MSGVSSDVLLSVSPGTLPGVSDHDDAQKWKRTESLGRGLERPTQSIDLTRWILP